MSTPFHRRIVIAGFAALCLLGLAWAQAPAPPEQPVPPGARIKVQRLADLPAHSYTVSEKASVLVEDPAAVLALADAVEKDIQADLAKYDIGDAATLRGLYDTLANIAMLRKDFPTARTWLEKSRDLEDKPSARLMHGVTDEALMAALEAPGTDVHATFRANLRGALAKLPYSVVQDEIKQTKGMTEILSRNLVVGSVASSLDPVTQTGHIGQDLARNLISTAVTLQYVIPYRQDMAAAYTAVLNAHRTARKPDIWRARDVTLSPSRKLHPVVVGIWDSGVDTKVYAGHLWTNRREIPNNNRDDDHNGFVDDVHGIAWDLHSYPTRGLLFPLSGGARDTRTMSRYLVGFTDLEANVDSPEADAVKRKIASLPQAQVRPFFENLGQYSNYAHGSHVTGIALRGDPAARILGCRITFDYHMIPEKPTIAQAKRDAAAYRRSVAYFKKAGVRVVNMSWGGSLQDIEHDLEVTRAGGTPEQRKKLARHIYDIGYRGMVEAMRSAPNILFVPAAGNSNNDVEFAEMFPSSIRLPNVIVAGAVDQAGDQTSFTSFGRIDVYSNGFEVPSRIPGGKVVKLSGTSMAAPQVTNLAAKIFAVNPNLSAAAVKRLIVNTSDVKTVNGRTLRLINPKRAITALRK